jgi:hypothetical protein
MGGLGALLNKSMQGFLKWARAHHPFVRPKPIGPPRLGYEFLNARPFIDIGIHVFALINRGYRRIC